MSNRKAFTLLEVLISIALLGIVIVALFSSVDMMQNSNQQLAQYLSKKIGLEVSTEETEIYAWPKKLERVKLLQNPEEKLIRYVNQKEEDT